MTDRIENDAYYTPTWMTQALIRRVPIAGSVLEPCAGDGGIASVIYDELDAVTDVWMNDIDPAQECDYYLDATKLDVFDLVRPDWVVTNPPFNAKLLPDIVKNALESAYIGVAMLLRLSFLEPTVERGGPEAWLCDNPPDLLIVTPRYSFTQNGKTDSVTTAWYVWYNQPSPDFDWRTQLIAPAWPKGIQIMRRSEMVTPLT